MSTRPFIEIKGRKIGYDYKPLIIAELGINHGGCLTTAFEMVDAAFEAGIEIIKHQTHIIEDEMSVDAKKIVPGNSTLSIYEIMKNCALNEEQEYQLKEYVESKGMLFISTPFSRAAADRLFKMNIQAYKIGSGECNNFPLLEHIASFGKPIILSTGMNSLQSIHKAVNIFVKHGIPYALLHCTNVYPTPPHLVRLGAMVELQNEFPNAVIGLSDHTVTNFACLGAVALGASILERHFTDHMGRTGPDIVCSMDKAAAIELLNGSGILHLERGGKKGPVAEEQPTINFAFASIVAIKNIKAGAVFSMENVWVKRPGTGELKADYFDVILGKKARNDIAIDTQLKKSDIE